MLFRMENKTQNSKQKAVTAYYRNTENRPILVYLLIWIGYRASSQSFFCALKSARITLHHVTLLTSSPSPRVSLNSLHSLYSVVQSMAQPPQGSV